MVKLLPIVFHAIQVVSVHTFEHHAKRQHSHLAFENTFTLTQEGVVNRQLRDVATAALSGHQDDGEDSPASLRQLAAPSASLSKPHVVTTSNTSADVTERSGDVQSRRSANKVTHAAHASDLKNEMSWKNKRARSHSAPASSAGPLRLHPHVGTERQKRSIPGVTGLEPVELGPPEKGHSASGSGKLTQKDGRRSSKSKRVRSGRRVLPAAAAPEVPADVSVAWLDGGLSLDGMWALQVEGLEFSGDEEPAAGASHHSL